MSLGLKLHYSQQGTRPLVNVMLPYGGGCQGRSTFSQENSGVYCGVSHLHYHSVASEAGYCLKTRGCLWFMVLEVQD